MAFESSSANMNMPLPGVGLTSGPQYATDLNDSLTIVDQHDHSPGAGVPVTPSGLNINADLPLIGNNLTQVRTVRMQAQASPLALSTDLDCVYVSGVDLYYNDGNGNQVRITQSGGVAGSPGSISGLSSPASASYNSTSKTFVWQSGASEAANLDAASLLMRNQSPNSTYALTLAPPSALGANYTLTLPSLPATKKIATITNTGNVAADYDVDNVTLEVSSSNLQIKALGVGTSQLANSAVTQAKKAAVPSTTSSGSGSYTTTSGSPTIITNQNAAITTTGRLVCMQVLSGSIGGTSSTTVDVTFGFMRNGIPINASQVRSNGTDSLVPAGSLTYYETPSANTYTYSVYAQVNNGGSTAVANGINFIVYEL